MSENKNLHARALISEAELERMIAERIDTLPGRPVMPARKPSPRRLMSTRFAGDVRKKTKE